jgi:hypothetical protein
MGILILKARPKKVKNMLLYQLTQWMEERSSLQKALKAGGDDSEVLQTQIDLLEEQLHAQAERWKSSIPKLTDYEVLYDAPQLDGDIRF